MTLRRCTVLAAVTCTAAALAGPASASGHTDVPVSLTVDVGGSRQFDVLEERRDLTLRALDLASTGSRAFRTRVRDEDFTAAGHSYTVAATMSNLYRRGDTAGTTHDVATKVRSSELSLSPGALSAEPPLVGVVPSLSVSGTLPTCAALPDDVRSLLGLPLGDLGLPLADVTHPLRGLCAALSAHAQQVTGTVDGVLREVQTDVVDPAGLATALTSGPASAFTVADYAHDATARLEPSAVRHADPATSVTVMRGAPGSADSAQGLLAQVDTLLTNALADVPFTGTGGAVPLSEARAMVVDGGLRSEVARLSDAQQAGLLNTLPRAGVAVADPVLSRLRLTTDHYATPTLRATMQAPVAGTYDGTLTLTFVQT